MLSFLRPDRYEDNHGCVIRRVQMRLEAVNLPDKQVNLVSGI